MSIYIGKGNRIYRLAMTQMEPDVSKVLMMALGLGNHALSYRCWTSLASIARGIFPDVSDDKVLSQANLGNIADAPTIPVLPSLTAIVRKADEVLSAKPSCVFMPAAVGAWSALPDYHRIIREAPEPIHYPELAFVREDIDIRALGARSSFPVRRDACRDMLSWDIHEQKDFAAFRAQLTYARRIWADGK